MRLRLCLLAISLSSSLFTAAQSKKDKAVILRLKEDIGYLASDELGGRRTGTEGERAAADYLIGRYRKLKIAPYGKDYRHPFEFAWGKEVGPTTVIRLNKETLRIPEDAFPLPFSDDGRLQSDAIPDVMEQGNVWLLPLYTSEEEAADAHYDWEKYAYEKSRVASKSGATGIVFYDPYNAKYPPAFNGRSEYEKVDIPVAFVQYKPWNTQTAKYTGDVPVELNIALRKSQRTGTNIVSFIDNKAPLTVVIGAHYDHLGHGEDGNSLSTVKDQIHNGADDNASGTAALLEIAARLKSSKLRGYNYVFAHFSGEELGLLGSKALVKETGLDSTKVAYMINMDMVGRLNDSTRALTIGGWGTSPVWESTLAPARQLFKVTLDTSGVGPSDHTSFYNAGVPVLFFFTNSHKDYHKPTDDADKINYAGEAQIIATLEGIVKALNKAPRPVYTQTKQTTVGKVRFKVTLGIMPDYSYTEEGVKVDGVSDGRPAAKAGVQAGDILLQLGADPINGMQSYMEALSHQKEGAKTTLKLRRGNKEMVLPIQL